MEQILTYILLCSGIILNLSMCFIAGITIGKLINNKEEEPDPPFPLGKPAIEFEIYEKRRRSLHVICFRSERSVSNKNPKTRFARR